MRFLNSDMIITSIPGLLLIILAVLVSPVGNVWAQGSVPDGVATSMPSEPFNSTNSTSANMTVTTGQEKSTGATVVDSTGATGVNKEICDDGIDNDRDGLTDGDDKDCRQQQQEGDHGDGTQAASQEVCNDGIDNDLDGAKDGYDKEDCFTSEPSTGEGDSDLKK